MLAQLDPYGILDAFSELLGELEDRIEARLATIEAKPDPDGGIPDRLRDEFRDQVERSQLLFDRLRLETEADVRGISDRITARLAELKNGRDGRDADPAVVAEAVAEAIAKLPPPRDGKDADPALVERLVAEAVAKLPPPEDGKDGAPGLFDPPVAWQEGVHYGGELVYFEGSTWCARRDTAARPPHEDWSPVAMRGQDGAEGYTGEPHGLWDPSAAYRRLDRVAWEGSEWIARRDDPGPLPGDGWMLGAQRGSKGKPGQKGDKGDAGASIVAAALAPDGYALLISTSDRRELRLDMRPLLERWEKERDEG